MGCAEQGDNVYKMAPDSYILDVVLEGGIVFELLLTFTT